MLVKVLGALDFLAGTTLIFTIWIKIPLLILVILSALFLVKAGIGLLKDFASWIDLIVGIIFVLLIFFPVYGIICLISAGLLIQKGIASFL